LAILPIISPSSGFTYKYDATAGAFTLAGGYLSAGQTSRALPILERVLNNPNVNGPALRAMVEIYSSINNTAGLESVVAKLRPQAQTNHGNPEVAICLSQAYRALQKNNEAQGQEDLFRWRTQKNTRVRRSAKGSGEKYGALAEK